MINTQFELSKYQRRERFDVEQQNRRNENLRAEIGRCIVDYDNKISEIGDLIFRYLDFQTKIAFSQVDSSCNTRSQRNWFVLDSRDIVLKYIQQGTSFKDYLLADGWKEGVLFPFILASVGLTIGAGIKSYQHAAQVPPDAPIKTKMEPDQDTCLLYPKEYIDHPEAQKADAWKNGALALAGVSLFLVNKEYDYLNRVNLNVFFSLTEKEIIDPQINTVLRWTFPGYYKWRWDKLKTQLSTNPTGWRQDSWLANNVCALSQTFMLFPVVDGCKNKHYFDYRSVRKFQLDSKNANPNSCPFNKKQPNNSLLYIKFDKGMFDSIQRSLKQEQDENLIKDKI